MTFAEQARQKAIENEPLIRKEKADACWKRIESIVTDGANQGHFSGAIDADDVSQNIFYPDFVKGMEDRGLTYWAVRKGGLSYSHNYIIHW